MLLYIFTVLCFSLALGSENDTALEWLTEYSLEATRISLTSGVIENYKAWFTNESSRVDYNNGADKTIIIGGDPDDDESYGFKYDIHPQTTDGDSNIMTCTKSKGSYNTPLVPQEILPSTETYDFEEVDYEFIDNDATVKFFYKLKNLNTDSRYTLWAKYDDDLQAWIPFRFEEIQYNDWIGSLSKHDIWDYYNFKTEVDKSVFNTEEYDCQAPEEVTILKPKELTKIDPENEEHVDYIFKTFQKQFNRNYAHQEEYAMRKKIFKDKLSLIVSTNRQNLGYKLTINKFADRTAKEMEKYQGLKRRPEGKVGNVAFPYTEEKINDVVADTPPEYDLRIQGLVSKIKDQEECGSCWTFGTTAAVEGALARINGGRLIALSNQALVDCAWPFGAAGCDGGSDNAAYEWMMKFGLPTEAEYGSYMNKDGFCRIHNMTKIFPIRGFTDVTPFSVGALKVAIINHGPLSVSVHVTEPFQLYSGGVFYDLTCNPTELNHEVTLVGYGQRDGDTFWILKNSWGPAWGIDGYMLISARDNNCGVMTEPTYVVF